MNNIALDGVTVIDLTRFAAGPYATMMLADMRARVIRVETRHNTDGVRMYGPLKNGESGYYMTLNRNKESITLDIKTEKGKEILWELISKADIVVENFRPGVAQKLSFGYDAVHAAKPSIVYASISGFGQNGSYSELPGYDIVVQAMGGLMDSIGDPDGPPLRVGTTIGDFVTSISASVSFPITRSKRKVPHIVWGFLFGMTIEENRTGANAASGGTARSATASAGGSKRIPITRSKDKKPCVCKVFCL